MATTYTWKKKAVEIYMSEIRKGLDRAALDVQTLTKRILSTKGKGTRYPNQPTRSSSPGHPPVVQTGTLRRSIQIDRSKNKGNRPKVRIGTNVEYAVYLELGTRHMEPRPFLRPALRKSKKRVSSRMKDAMNTAVKQIGKLSFA